MSDLRTIPRDPGLDHTLALGREGYPRRIDRRLAEVPSHAAASSFL